MSYVSKYELRNAYEDCKHNKTNTDNCINFEINEDEELEKLYKELNSMSYKIGKSIVFTLYDKSIGGAHREVFAADFRDRIVHHLIVNRIIDKLEHNEWINDNYACRKNKGTLYGAKRCQEQMNLAKNEYGNAWVLKGDFKNFFCSLNKELLYKSIEDFMLKNYKDNKKLNWNLWLLKMIVMHCPQHKGNYIRKQPKRFWKGLPKHKCMFLCDDNHSLAVGNLTSQIFANLFLSKFDHYVKDTLGYKYYGRFVDDFYIISNNKENLNNDYKLLCNWVKENLDLNINTNKFYLQPINHGVKFVGYDIYLNKFYMQRKSLYRFDNKIYGYNKVCKKFYDIHKNISLLEARPIMDSWNSYVGLLSHTDCKDYYLKLLSKYNEFREVMLNICDIDRNGYMRYNKYMKKLLYLYYTYGVNTCRVYIDKDDDYKRKLEIIK